MSDIVIYRYLDKLGVQYRYQVGQVKSIKDFDDMLELGKLPNVFPGVEYYSYTDAVMVAAGYAKVCGIEGDAYIREFKKG